MTNDHVSCSPFLMIGITNQDSTRNTALSMTLCAGGGCGKIFGGKSAAFPRFREIRERSSYCCPLRGSAWVLPAVSRCTCGSSTDTGSKKTGPRESRSPDNLFFHCPVDRKRFKPFLASKRFLRRPANKQFGQQVHANKRDVAAIFPVHCCASSCPGNVSWMPF